MNLDKKEAIELIRSLPDDCTIEDIRYHLDVRLRVVRGLSPAEGGRLVSQVEEEQRVAGWAKSPGPDPR